MEGAVLHDRQHLLAIGQDRKIGERIAIDQQQVGEEAFLELTQLAWPLHDRAAMKRRREQRLHRRHAGVFDEILQILGVLAVARPGEAVIAAR